MSLSTIIVAINALANATRAPIVTVPGAITTIAGGGVDDGCTARGGFPAAESIAVDSCRNICVADETDHRIRTVDARTHRISTFAGDGGPATRAH